MVFPFSYGFPMGFPMIFPCSYGFPMVFFLDHAPNVVGEELDPLARFLGQGRVVPVPDIIGVSEAGGLADVRRIPGLVNHRITIGKP